ncbi:MAG: hypothetical protein AB8B87_11080 [Granulosicoccus sp.]
MFRKTTTRRFYAVTVVIGTLLYSSAALAQDDKKSMLDSAFDGWSGTASLGATSSTGNSKSSNINGSVRLGKTIERWEHLVFGSIFKGSSSIVIVETDQNNDPILGDDGRPQRIIVKGDNSDRIALGYQPKFYY